MNKKFWGVFAGLFAVFTLVFFGAVAYYQSNFDVFAFNTKNGTMYLLVGQVPTNPSQGTGECGWYNNGKPQTYNGNVYDTVYEHRNGNVVPEDYCYSAPAVFTGTQTSVKVHTKHHNTIVAEVPSTPPGGGDENKSGGGGSGGGGEPTGGGDQGGGGGTQNPKSCHNGGDNYNSQGHHDCSGNHPNNNSGQQNHKTDDDHKPKKTDDGKPDNKKPKHDNKGQNKK